MVNLPAHGVPSVAIPEAMAPVVDTRYWDGHALGDGSGVAFPAAPKGQAGARAVEVLDLLVSQSSPLGYWDMIDDMRAYGPGETFSVEDHIFGTTALFRQEELRRTSGSVPYPDMSAIAGDRDLPEPRTDLQTNFSTPPLERATADRIIGAGLMYTSRVHLGIVVLGGQDGRRLFSVPHHRAFRNARDPEIHVSTLWGSTAEPEEFKIGEVRHYSGPRWIDERLVRVTALSARSLADMA